MTYTIRFKRIYEEPSDDDGYRILVDRLWPRGIKKENAHIDEWAKDIAPSNALRTRYHADQDYDAFVKDYEKELDENAYMNPFLDICKEHLQYENVTLLSASKNIDQCNASALKSILLKNHLMLVDTNS